MKRDMDLVRDILLYVERCSYDALCVPVIDGRSDEDVAYHVALLKEAGLLQASPPGKDGRAGGASRDSPGPATTSSMQLGATRSGTPRRTRSANVLDRSPSTW
jgi:hypothetical protein